VTRGFLGIDDSVSLFVDTKSYQATPRGGGVMWPISKDQTLLYLQCIILILHNRKSTTEITGNTIIKTIHLKKSLKKPNFLPSVATKTPINKQMKTSEKSTLEKINENKKKSSCCIKRMK
jgi:hypothetical protein